MTGPTLFTGVRATLTVRPAPPHTGIVFRTGAHTSIPALASHIVPESRRTVLAVDPADPFSPRVQTVEHILSALAGLGITDTILDLDGPEVPIGDGSAKLFTDALAAAGIVPLAPAPAPTSPTPEPRHGTIRVREPFFLEEDDGRIEASPPANGELELTYDLDYGPDSPIPAQTASLHFAGPGAAASYVESIAPARTFCLLDEAQAMRKMGLFRHLDPSDMLVIGPRGPIDNTYRFANEPARHKLLDLLGDLSLAGGAIHGRIRAYRSGHTLNHAMARALAALADRR